MLADFFSKPPGGSLFAMMRDICQGTLTIEQLSIRHNIKVAKEKGKEVSSEVHKEFVERENKNLKQISMKNEK